MIAENTDSKDLQKIQPNERFDGNFMLFTGEFAELLTALVGALGGIVQSELA